MRFCHFLFTYGKLGFSLFFFLIAATNETDTVTKTEKKGDNEGKLLMNISSGTCCRHFWPHFTIEISLIESSCFQITHFILRLTDFLFWSCENVFHPISRSQCCTFSFSKSWLHGMTFIHLFLFMFVLFFSSKFKINRNSFGNVTSPVWRREIGFNAETFGAIFYLMCSEESGDSF